ncbi:MAG: hypothetical protein ABIS18_04915 [Actinomycetota bacterium]
MNPTSKRRRIVWTAAILVLLVPIPTSDGPWLPLLFMFFEWMNSFLPSNF